MRKILSIILTVLLLASSVTFTAYAGVCKEHAFGKWEYSVYIDDERNIIGVGKYRTCEKCGYEEERCITEDENPYVDVSLTDGFAPGVMFCREYGYMIGTSANTFSPYDMITRAMYLQILYNYSGFPDIEDTDFPFSDVPENAWYTRAVKWGYANGYTAGRGGGIFDPNANITKSEFAVMTYKFVLSRGYTVEERETHLYYTNTDEFPEYAKEAIRKMFLISMFGIPEDGRLDPYEQYTRGRMADAIRNFDGILDFLEEQNKPVYTSGDYKYTLSDEGAEIVEYSGNDTSVTVPNDLDGHPVISIGTSAFSGLDITDIKIPNGVKRIRESAFELLTSLKEVYLPESVEVVERSAFFLCTALEKVTFNGFDTSINKSIFEVSNIQKICGYDGSTADTFASENGIEFESLSHPEGLFVFGKYYAGEDISTVSCEPYVRLITKEGFVSYSNKDNKTSDELHHPTTVFTNSYSALGGSMTFCVDEGFFFGDNDGYNGCISVAVADAKVTDIPYPRGMNESFVGGGLAYNEVTGIIITLYPASDGSGKGTTLVHSYRIAVKDNTGVLIDEKSGVFENDIDVSKDTEIRIDYSKGNH